MSQGAYTTASDTATTTPCGESLLQSPRIVRRIYIHERPDWPRLHWRPEALANALADVRHRQGRLLGRMETLGFDLRREAVLGTLVEDVVKSSDIEGEKLDSAQVRSSITRRLGMDGGGLGTAERDVEGVVGLMLDATGRFDRPLTAERLFDWHASLFPTGRSGMRRIAVGRWRGAQADPMQVVSGPIGRERVHFEAPSAARVDAEMRAFLQWFEAPADADPVLRAGLAHLWFVTVHPFEDGNGRIARAVADMALARSEGSSQRFYSMSSQTRAERAAYYDVLERTQRGTTDVTDWMTWFLACLGRSIEAAGMALTAVPAKARFWEHAGGLALNERQRRVLNRVLDGFEGKLTTSKWARLAKCSQDTALRDMTVLAGHGLLARNPGGGRNPSYRIVTDA